MTPIALTAGVYVNRERVVHILNTQFEVAISCKKQTSLWIGHTK